MVTYLLISPIGVLTSLREGGHKERLVWRVISELVRSVFFFYVVMTNKKGSS